MTMMMCRAPTTFSNEYFKELLNNEWTLKTWDGPDQFEDPTGALMMLPADMALLWDKVRYTTQYHTYLFASEVMLTICLCNRNFESL